MDEAMVEAAPHLRNSTVFWTEDIRRILRMMGGGQRQD